MGRMSKRIEMELKLKDAYSKTIKAAQGSTKKFASTSKGSWNSVGNYIKTAGAYMAMYFGVRAMTGLVTRTVDTAVEVDNLSKSFGMQHDKLQELQHVANITGVAFTHFAKAQKNIARTAYDATQGMKEQKEAYEDLGIQLTNTDGTLRSIDDLFDETMAALGAMTNKTERAALAMKIMGKSGSELLPIVNDDTKAIKDLRQEAHALGKVMTEEQILAARELGDTWQRLEDGATGLARSLMFSLQPALDTLGKWMVDHAKRGMGYEGAFGPSAKMGPGTEEFQRMLKEGMPRQTALQLAPRAATPEAGPKGDPLLGMMDAMLGEQGDVKEVSEEEFQNRLAAVNEAREQATTDHAKRMAEQEATALAQKEDQTERWYERQRERETERRWHLEEDLRTWNMTELELIEEKLTRELDMLEGNTDAQLQARRRYAKAALKIRDAQAKSELSRVATSGQQMTNFMGSFLGDQHALTKSFGIATAGINMWIGASEALKLPFPENIAAFAQVLATGIQAVDGIKGTSPGKVAGRSGGAGAGGSRSGAPPTEPDPIFDPGEHRRVQRSVEIHIHNPIGETEWVREVLLPKMTEAMEDNEEITEALIHVRH